jgi:tetratricopeptide (TPR) repeat protein
MPADTMTIDQAFQLALAHHQAGRLPEAEALYRQILATDQRHSDSLHLLGVIAIQVGRNDVAVGLIREALTLNPQVPAYHSNLGNALSNLGRLDEAIAHCSEAARLKPDFAEAYINLGFALKAVGRIEDAATSYREALRINPTSTQAHINLANLLQEQKRYAKAETGYREALRIAPETADAHAYLATALQAQDKFGEAEFHCREALRIRHNFPEAHNNLAWMLEQRGELEGAIAFAREAIRLRPDFPDAHMNLSAALLLTGQFDEGWREYEWRWRHRRWPSQPRGFTQPLWLGEAVKRRVLLIHAEQGMGDSIMFGRYVSMIAATARVVLEAPQPLVRLFASLKGVEQIVATGSTLPKFDLQCPMMSLGRAFGTTVDTIPARIPYLSAEPELVAKWRERLADIKGLKIGIAWAGHPSLSSDKRRSIALDKFAWLAAVPGVTFVSLQKDEAAREALLPPSGMVLRNWAEELEDFADSAALIEALDLVISVDTAVVHLAGAMGKPVWLLNRFAPDWRWLTGRDDSPWYPTLRQFRQTKPGDWDGALARVAAALRKVAGGDLTELTPPQTTGRPH